MIPMPRDWRAELRRIASDKTHPEHQQLTDLWRDMSAHLPEMLAWCTAWTDAEAEAEKWSQLLCTLPPGEVPELSVLATMVLGIKQADRIGAQRLRAQAPRKRPESEQIDAVKRLMRNHRSDHDDSLDKFLKSAQQGGVDGLVVKYDPQLDTYEVQLPRDFDEPLKGRKHGAIKGWWRPQKIRTLRT
jgi:hypothetical protein